MAVLIYHNPRCTKSRQTLQLLEERNEDVQVVEYLKLTPGRMELRNIMKHLGFSSPREMMRTKEDVYNELNLADTSLSDDTLIDMMAKYPILIERPIVVNGTKAAIGRPPENVLAILD